MAKWLDDAVFYEIYPQSFKDTNSDGIGDFGGIREKLDYIKELGCNAIWMNPCFESPFGDAGYDVSDYYKAAPRYGTNDELKKLMDEVHDRGMHILLDLVPGHTSIAHKWFQESMRAEQNAYTDRYVWTDNIWETPEGPGALRGISDRDGSCLVSFFSHQPALNYGYYRPEKPWQQAMDAPGPRATVAELKKIMRFWLTMGCDGFRVDMAHSLVKGDEEGKGTVKLWQEIRAFLDEEFPEAVMVSEWGEPDKALEGGFHMDFLLHFGPSHYNDLFRCEEPYFSGRGKGDVSEFVRKYQENYEKTAGKGMICIPSGNHDMDRLARSIHGDELKVAFAFLLSMPGAPFIYYGDEIGMRYVEGLTSVEGGYNRTGSRSPMQWDDSVNAGFSLAGEEKLYISLDPGADRPTVEGQLNDPASLYHEVKELIAFRQEHPALKNRGGIEFVCAKKNAYPFVYVRSGGDEGILVILNPSGEPASFACEYSLSEALRTFGGEITVRDKKVLVPAGFYGFYRVKPFCQPQAQKLHERFEFRNIRPEEAEQAAEIERICFPPNEACSRERIFERAAAAPELFLVAADKKTGRLAGFLNGLSTEETSFRDEFFTDITLYHPEGKNIMLLGLDVLPEYRRQGLGRELMNQYLSRERRNGRRRILLTCLQPKVEMYKKMGFCDNGIANSSWGGEEWHEMSRMI